jgi:hypothetical protein
MTDSSAFIPMSRDGAAFYTMPAPTFIDLGDPARVVAVGDIHGDLDALLRILQGFEVLAADGTWAGGDTSLVLLGDLNDRGNDSVNVMDFLMALEPEAAAQGGSVHVLIGNHELLAAEGEYRYATAAETLSLEHWWFDNVNGLPAVYRGNSPYAAWLRARPVLLKACGTLFVHAGLGPRAAERLHAVGDAVRAWIAYYQGVGPEPDPATFWIVSENDESPIWMDTFRLTRGGRPECAVEAALDRACSELEVRRLVIGHRPTAVLGYRVAFPHPAYGDRVANIDTGISQSMGGRLAGVEIDGTGIRPRYFERGERPLDLTGRIRSLCEQRRERIAAENAGTS